MRQGIILLLGLVCSVSGWTQEAVFPYPELPASLTDDRARLCYMLEHFWERYDFSDTLHANQQVGEQGLVDFVTLMAYPDSATCAKAANAFADSISSSEQRLGRFEDLLRHYLENPQSPLRNDTVYSHLLRALPTTPQRQFLIRQLSLNRPGTQSVDFSFVDAEGNRQRLYALQGQYILLVFFDPQCEHCQEQMPQIKREPLLQKTSGLKVVYIDTNLNPDVMKVFYLPALPSLYLLDAHKRVVVKDGSLQQIVSQLNVLLP
jgi:hypothetical protein